MGRGGRLQVGGSQDTGKKRPCRLGWRVWGRGAKVLRGAASDKERHLQLTPLPCSCSSKNLF